MIRIGCSNRTLLTAVVSVSLLWAFSAVRSTEAADRIILRNLKVLTDRAITSFDQDGVRLDDGTVLGWDAIEKASVGGDRQAAFDKMLAEFGEHLYRIRQRLRVGDYKGLLPHAEALAERYQGHTSDSAYMVFQALMWAYLADGQREAALLPYLRCYDILRKRGTTRLELPGDRRLEFDPQTGLAKDLAPVWFDAAAARVALPRVFESIRNMSVRPDGLYVYFGTLALAAEDAPLAERALRPIKGTDGTVAELVNIIEAQRQVLTGQPTDGLTRLETSLPGISSANKPLALYWLGRGKLAGSEASRQDGLLALLRIPAVHGQQQPELAGAAIFAAMEALQQMQDLRGSVALRSELLGEYGNTHFARQVNNGRMTKSEP